MGVQVGGDGMRWTAGAFAGAALLLTGTAAGAQLPALRDRPLSAAERTRLSALESQFARVSQQRSLSVAAVRAIAQALGERLTTQNPDQLIRAIDERAQELGAARSRISQLERDLEAMDSMRLAQAVGPLLTQANAAIEGGQLSEAEAKLAEASERFASARQNLQGQVNQLATQEAGVLEQRAAVRLAVFDDVAAAELLGQAAALIPDSDAPRRYALLMRQGDVLSAAGSVRADTSLLTRALAVFRDQALPLAPRETRFSDWRRTQRASVAALTLLGQRTGDAAKLDEALGLIREIAAATPQSDPQEWALSQAVLGQTLSSRGIQAGDVSMLRAAVATFAGASEALAASPWNARRIGIERERAKALQRLANLTNDAATARQIGEVARAALAHVDRQTNLRDWVELQTMVVGSLWLQGQSTRDPAPVAEAVALQRGLVESFPEADTQARLGARINLAGMLNTQAELQGAQGRASAEEAVRLLQDVATPAFRAQSVDGWRYAQRNLGVSRLMLARLTGAAADYAAAAADIRALQAVETREVSASSWTTAQVGLARALSGRAAALPQTERAAARAEAEAAWRVALESARSAGLPASVAEAEAALAAPPAT